MVVETASGGGGPSRARGGVSEMAIFVYINNLHTGLKATFDLCHLCHACQVAVAEGISAVSKFLDDRGLVGVIRFFRSNRRRTEQAAPGSTSHIQIIRQRAVRQILSLTRP